MTTTSTSPQLSTRNIELDIGGMTCASCAMRIEKKLNKIDGVSATVNYATEKAKVSLPDSYDPQELVQVVANTGYTATLPKITSKSRRDRFPVEPREELNADPELISLKQRMIGAIVLAVPV